MSIFVATIVCDEETSIETRVFGSFEAARIFIFLEICQNHENHEITREDIRLNEIVDDGESTYPYMYKISHHELYIFIS